MARHLSEHDSGLSGIMRRTFVYTAMLEGEEILNIGVGNRAYGGSVGVREGNVPGTGQEETNNKKNRGRIFSL